MLEGRAKLEGDASLLPIALSTNRLVWLERGLMEHIMKKPFRSGEAGDKRATIRGKTAEIVKKKISTPGAGDFTVVDVYVCKKLLLEIRKTPYIGTQEKGFWEERVSQTLWHGAPVPDVPSFTLDGKKHSLSASIKHSME